MPAQFKARRFLFAALLVVTMASCSSLPKVDTDSVRQRLSTVNKANGIDGEEAMIIAQNFMLDNGFDYDWDVTNPHNDGETDDARSWSIAFPPIEDGWGSGRRKSSEVTFEQMMPFFVKVDKTTGEAVGSKTILREGISQ